MNDPVSSLRKVGFRGWTTLLKIAVIAVVKVVVSLAYLERAAPDHYLLHPLIALNSALPVLLVLRVYGVSTREEIIVSYAFLHFARFPDYLFEAGIDHEEWMNVFLLHVAFDEIISYAVPFLGVIVSLLLAAYVGLKLRTARESPRRH